MPALSALSIIWLLALLVVIFYLRWMKKPIFFVVIPLLMMLIFPAWALIHQLRTFLAQGNYLLVGFSIFVLLLQAWMVIEAVAAWGSVSTRSAAALEGTAPNFDGGRAC